MRNPEEHKKLWLLLGAQVTMAGPLELLKFPGLFVILTKGEPAGTRIDLTEGLAGR